MRRRLDAYDHVQAIVGVLRGTTYKDEGSVSELAPMVFALGSEGVMQINQAVVHAMSNSLWLDPPTRDLLVELNRLLQYIPLSDDATVVFAAGAKLRMPISDLRERLETSVAESLQNLHNVDRFLRSKLKVSRAPAEPRWERLPRHRPPEANSQPGADIE